MSNEIIPQELRAQIDAHLGALITRLTADNKALTAERDEARAENRQARRIISATHKNCVKHDNCGDDYCPICVGGLFMCAECGAAELHVYWPEADGKAQYLIESLTAAGYRILGPDELDPVTVERCAKLAETHRHPRGSEHEDMRWQAGTSSAASAIRTLSPEVPQPEDKEAREDE